MNTTIKDSQSLEAFYREFNQLAEAYPMVTLLAVTPEDHNLFLPESLQRADWKDPIHQRMKDGIGEEIDMRAETPWDALNAITSKIAERIDEEEESK